MFVLNVFEVGFEMTLKMLSQFTQTSISEAARCNSPTMSSASMLLERSADARMTHVITKQSDIHKDRLTTLETKTLDQVRAPYLKATPMCSILILSRSLSSLPLTLPASDKPASATTTSSTTSESHSALLMKVVTCKPRSKKGTSIVDPVGGSGLLRIVDKSLLVPCRIRTC